MADEYNSRQARKNAQAKSKPKATKNKPPKQKKSGILKKIALALAILIGLGVVGGGVAVAVIIAGAPDIDEERLTLPQSLQIHDMDDELAFTLAGSERRINADINDMPDHLKQAFIAVEDHRFEEHFGVDLRRLGGAVIANFREGFGAEGASTITQQLVKNLFLTNEKALTRKIQEAYLAIQLERRYTKDEILEMYLNQINLGPTAGYGVQLASETYFNKEDLSELTVADAATLAAIPQRPSHFDPYTNPENNEQRRNTVIDRMERESFISGEEAEEARNTPIDDQINYTQSEDDTGWLTFYDEVLTELENMTDLTTNDIYNSGLQVYTTLDMDAQETVDNALKSSDLPFPDNEDFRAGITLLDNNTGAIRAMGNGIEENEARVSNFATIRRNQGSTMKPLLAYAPVINEKQWSTAQRIVDETYYYSSNPDVEVRNYDRSHRGPMSMRQSLAQSRNVTAVKALEEAGIENAYEFLDPMIEIDEQSRTPSGTLGSAYASTKEMAGAYAAFANNGEYTEPYTIRKIVFPDGRELNLQPETEQVMEDYTGYMITDMLKTAVTSGTGTAAQVSGVNIAGKTGTANFGTDEIQRYNIPSGGFPASAFTGYSTNYTASVWIGFKEDNEGNYLTQTHNRIAQQLFQSVMTQVHEGVDTPDFTKPDSVEEVRVERGTGKLPSAGTPSSEIITELFVRGTGPSEVSEEFAEISDPTNVSYSYDEENESIEFSWSYPSDELDDVEFETSINSGSLNVDESSMTATLSNVTPGESYTFTVRANATDGTGLRSASRSVTATIDEAVEEEEEEEEEPDDEETTPPDEEEEEEPPADEDGGDSDSDNNGDESDSDNPDSENGSGGGDSGDDTNNDGSDDEPNNGNDGEETTPEQPDDEPADDNSTDNDDGASTQNNNEDS